MGGNGKGHGLEENQAHPVTPAAEPEAAEPSRPPGTQEARRPVLFISHRHADYQLADMLRGFIEQRASEVEIFQSSYEGGGPSIGKLLSEDLGQRLSAAEVVLLLYTTPDENWSYCMWEVGVAFNPEREDTRVIVLQAGADIPAPLGDRTAVRLASDRDVKQFVAQLFTDPKLFPKYGKALWPSRAPDSEVVKRVGSELWGELRNLGIREDSETVWKICTAVVFSISLSVEEEMKKTHARLGREVPESEKQPLLEELRQSLADNLRIETASRGAGEMFGLHLRPETTLQNMIDAWQNDRNVEAVWAAAVLDQLMRVVVGQWPRSQYCGLRHASDERAYVPILQQVCRRPSAGLVEYHFALPRFDFDEESHSICIPMAG